MTNDVPYRHPDTGQERNLPEGVGEKLGYERIAGFDPPEITTLDISTLVDEIEQSVKADSELIHAATVVYGVATNGAEEVSPNVHEALSQLSASLIAYGFGPAVKTFTLKDAVLMLKTTSEKEDLSEEETSQLKQVADLVLAQNEVAVTLPVPVSADAFAQLTERVEKDDKISKTAREAVLHHIKMVSTAPAPVVSPDQAPAE